MRIRPFVESEARAVASWAYEPPFDVYDGDPTNYSDYLTIDDDGYGFYAIAASEHDVVGFCCFGEQARVRGQVPIDGVVDIGGGIRPDLVSHGIATSVFPAIIEFAASTFGPTLLRTAVASSNERSTRLCLTAGFSIARAFDGPGREFRELLRPAWLPGSPNRLAPRQETFARSTKRHRSGGLGHSPRPARSVRPSSRRRSTR